MNGDEVTIYNEPTITNPNDATYQWKGEPGSVMTTFNLRDAYNELIANNTGQEAEMNKIANVLKVGEQAKDVREIERLFFLHQLFR